MLFYKVKNLINKGNSRSVKAKKNIFLTLALKGIDFSSDFLIVPLSLSLLSNIEYGLWMTIASILNWLTLIDFGLGHGFRNKLAEAIASNNISEAKELTSTAYFSMSIIGFLILIIGTLPISIINWDLFFMTPEMDENLTLIIQIVWISFIIKLILQLFNSICSAYQIPYINNLILSLTRFFILMSIYFYSKLFNLSFLDFVLIQSFLPVILLILFSIIFFYKKYRSIKPDLKFFKFNRIKELYNLGLRFFIIQLGSVIMFSSDNIIITRIFGPSEVTPYQITHKFFGYSLMIFNVILMPYWSSITDAYVKGEIQWIKNAIKNLERVWLGLLILIVVMILIFNPIKDLWVGSSVNISFALVIQWALFVLIQSYNGIYSYFLNGIGKIYIQMLSSIMTIIFNIPLSIFLAKYFDLGIVGVILATNLILFIYAILKKIQYNKIISNKAYGVWNR